MALGTTNISTTLVGTTLGTSSRDVGTLCTHPNINPLSKYKPVRSIGMNQIDKTGNPNWWKTPDGMCSISIPNATIQNGRVNSNL